MFCCRFEQLDTVERQCGGESVSQSPLMYKLFFIPALGHLLSSLPVIGLSVRPLRLKPLCRMAYELVRKSSRGPLHRSSPYWNPCFLIDWQGNGICAPADDVPGLNTADCLASRTCPELL